MNPYGYISFWRIDIHYITMVCMGILYIVYYRRIGDISNKLLRLGLPLIYCFGAAMHYEIFWNAGWTMSWYIVVLDVIGFCVCEGVIWMAIRDLKYKFHYDIPQIDLDRWVYVSCYFGLAISWLVQTDFYIIYKQIHLLIIAGDPIALIGDPHNHIWAIGKLGTLFWIWVAPGRKNK